ncbi:hypothetical protein SUGI_0932860 [Cryptomeria japonica]|nr:hypothetical protein SUGI_0932860 [Cryptomeria japonica]
MHSSHYFPSLPLSYPLTHSSAHLDLSPTPSSLSAFYRPITSLLPALFSSLFCAHCSLLSSMSTNSTTSARPEMRSRRLFPCCLGRSVESNPSASTTTASIAENEVMIAFRGIAPSPVGTSSQLIKNLKPSFDVFINHRGPDVKHKLAGSIYNILNDMEITVFLDSKELEYGDFMPTTLEAAMRGASLHIAIFSKRYAESPWCLEELFFMLKTGAKIIPVFYYVEPTDLRYVAQRKGIYVDAFKKHEKKRRYSPEKLREWKKALYDVSFYTGEIIRNNNDEMRLLKNIVNIVLKEVNNVPLVVANHPVALKETVQDFELNTVQPAKGDQGVQIVGIWGMGGSGKTTLAKELYNRRYSSMERSCFIFDVRDSAAKGLLQNKQIQLLNDLAVKNVTFDSIEQGKAILTRHLRSARVLIVLDDVDAVDQLDALLPAKDSLGGGSLIIVTTRDKDVLRSWGEKNNLAIEVWNGSGWSGLHSWERLLNKCLVELDDNNRIRMHHHLRDLGREIAKQHSPYRLWLPQQIINAQTEIRNGIRGIKAVPTGIVEWRSYGEELMANISGGILSLAPSLVGLKLFVIRGDYFNQIIGGLSRELVWLRWFQIGQINLPSWLSLKNLRVLELYEDYGGEHHLEELWKADSDAPVQLRELVISNCHRFQKFPNSIGCLNELKKIVITSGNNVRSLPEEFCRLQSLEHLQLSYCGMLSSLPSSFGDLRNLRHLELSHCRNLRRLPASFTNLMLLQHLTLQWCGQLILASEDFEKITKLEYLDLSGCDQLEELPPHISKQASLRELYLIGMKGLKELPINIGQLRRLRKMEIRNELLTCLPNSLGELSSLTDLSIQNCPKLESLPISLGDLFSLTNLRIGSCPKLKCLPCSLGLLNLLQELTISVCPISQVDFGAALPFALSNLKRIFLHKTELCSILISEDRHTRLESLSLYNNDHLTEIEALPTTVKSMGLTSCKVLKNARVIYDLVNLECLHIMSCPELAELPSFARLTSLRECDRIEKIEGLENCTRLESLRVDTCWEVPGIESLEHMEKLRTLELRANKGSAIQRCIQTIQKWPDDIMICTRAVPDAASLVDSLLSPNLVVGDSIFSQKIKSRPKLVEKRSSNGNALMLCSVINCVSSQMELMLMPSRRVVTSKMKTHEGQWVWTCLFTQRSTCLTAEEFLIDGWYGECEEDDEVQKALFVREEEQTLVGAFHSFTEHLSIV